MIDLVCVGSGPVGSAFVRTVLDELPAARILMVDPGQILATPPGSHLKNIADAGLRDEATLQSGADGAVGAVSVSLPDRGRADALGSPEELLGRPGLFLIDAHRRLPGEDGMSAASAISCVGGMATQWTAACPRPSGSEVIPFLDESELDAALSTAESYLGVSSDVIGQVEGNERIRRVLSGLFDAERAPGTTVRSMPMAVSRAADGRRQWGGTDTVLGDALIHPHVELRPRTRCVRIETDGDRAVGVHLVDLETGLSRFESCRNVVVAAGALHGAQLLHASGIQPPALGRHLNDHHMVVGAVAMDRFPEGEDASEPHRIGADQTTGVTWIPFDDKTLPLHGQVMHTDASPVGADGATSADGEQIVSLGWFAPKDLSPDDRLELSTDEVDATGMPRMTIHYRLSDLDKARIALAEEQLSLMTEALGVPVYPEVAYVMPRGFSLHYQGTLRMGAVDDGHSVCDRTSRVWGTQNVFVAGNGVIPTETACNPTLTSVALAVLAGKQLIRDLSS